jgi:hypothetical protein
VVDGVQAAAHAPRLVHGRDRTRARRLDELGWTGGEAIRDLVRRSTTDGPRRTGGSRSGSAGLQPDLARQIDHRYDYEARYARRVANDLYRMFPAFEGVPIEAAWGGPINVSGFTMPFFGTFGEGQRALRLGFTGNGVGPSHLAGKILASLALHADDGFGRLAVVTRTPKRFPPEPFRSPGAFVVQRGDPPKGRSRGRGPARGSAHARRRTAPAPTRLQARTPVTAVELPRPARRSWWLEEALALPEFAGPERRRSRETRRRTS